MHFKPLNDVIRFFLEENTRIFSSECLLLVLNFLSLTYVLLADHFEQWVNHNCVFVLKKTQGQIVQVRE